MQRWLSSSTNAALLACSVVLGGCQHKGSNEATNMTESAQVDLYTAEAKTLEGQPAPLAQYRGRVTLVVNVASECGFTPQYAGLQQLYERYEGRGLTVLGFPSNDFGRQEPGSAEEIREFCSSKYRVKFPMFEKVQTKAGAGQSPVYALLQQGAGALPKWNFGKYLVGRNGKVIKFFPSDTKPESAELTTAIEAALAESA
jgi:glutathione peroxidase